jgi:hypothetical protein
MRDFGRGRRLPSEVAWLPSEVAWASSEVAWTSGEVVALEHMSFDPGAGKLRTVDILLNPV